MSFSERLNEYCTELGCTNKQLAQRCGISASALSRYRNGERTPAVGSDALDSLAEGISSLARETGVSELSNKQMVLNSLAASLKKREVKPSSFGYQLGMLMEVLAIPNVEMARAVNIDPSYLSRIRNGRRLPASPEQLAESIAEYTVERAAGGNGLARLAELLGDAEVTEKPSEALIEQLIEWLLSEDAGSALGEAGSEFLRFLDEFDLNDFIKTIHFDEMKVPTAPITMPASRFCHGVEAMRKAEIDFLRATATSRHAKEAIMYSDVSMEEMAADSEFDRQWMVGLAAMLKRGINFQIIHNLNRPFNEMMLGLQSWIPLYMTGQVQPYYLIGEHDKVFRHLYHVSNVAAVAGEGLAGYGADSRFYYTTKRQEVAYYMGKMRQLLKMAQPLLQIYREDDPMAMRAFEQAEEKRRAELNATELGGDVFNNIRIVSYEGDCMVISKTNDPAIHFVTSHPKLCQAINQMVPVILK